MKKDSIVDYFSCILVRLFGPVIRSLPFGFSLFLGRRLGDLLYYFDLKHKTIAYANIKTALGDKLSPLELSRLTKASYRAFGQNLIEMFFIPLVDKEYVDKYITFEGLDYLQAGLKRNKGVIILTVHAGIWEFGNAVFSAAGFPFAVFARNQRYPRLDKLLNLYRARKGQKAIPRENGLRHLIQAFQDNQIVGMTIDQGGKTGLGVKFFGKDASMGFGAVKLALRYDAALIVAFSARLKGPRVKIMLNPPFMFKRSGNLEQDVSENLQAIIRKFEEYVAKYPQEYLWTYRVWKYGKEREILILSDARTGHLRQSQAVAGIAGRHLGEKGIKAKVNIVEIKFKNKLARTALAMSNCLAGKYQCQGCLWCLKTFLKKDVYSSLIGLKPDIIISCGSSLAPINFVLSRESLAKSIVILRPSFLSTHRFDLVIMPRHDNPPRRKNVAVTEGALNLIDEEYLREQSVKLSQVHGSCLPAGRAWFMVHGFCIGLLIGGDTKNFHLDKNIILEVIKQIKSVAQELNADILVTTSRRTSSEIEKLVKKEFKDYSRCKVLIIANEKNILEAVGGILGLSKIIVTSPESISMISEAASSKKYVLVFESPGLSKRHWRFIDYFARSKYIYLAEPCGLSKAIEDIWLNKPPIHNPRDSLLVREAIKKNL